MRVSGNSRRNWQPARACWRRHDALIDKKCNLDRRIVAVCRLELERVCPVIVRSSTAPAAQAIQ